MLKCLNPVKFASQLFNGVNVKMLKNKGFTLVEMMVTVVIFSVIVGATIGVFVSAIRTQKYNLAYQQLLDQTSYAMEYMSRAIRMAKKNDGVVCSVMGTKNYEVPGEGNSLKFATYHNQCWKFFREDERLKVNKGGTPYDLTSDDFKVKYFNVEVSGDELSGDNLQPRVTIFMEVEGRGSVLQAKPRLKTQTTISQRNLDI